MIKLRFHAATAVPVEAECITPDSFTGKSIGEIAKLPVQHGNRTETLGDFFHVEGDAADGHIQIEGDCSRVKWIGAGMTQGTITIHGDVGMHLGSEMAGGEIAVRGNAGDWVGGEMRGGKIHVHGDAGHLVGAAYRGSRLGMRGGVILIDGNAGNEIAATMRRGFIAIGGATGDFPGVGMIAGSLFVFGAPGLRPAAGMKRGTLALFGEKGPLLPTFRPDCVYRPVFMTLFVKQLQAWHFAPAQRIRGGRYRRFSGDLVSLGKGEILVWEA